MYRLISCRKATLFIEKHADAALSTGERGRMWLHLSYCPNCRRYAEQSRLLNQLLHSPAKARGRALPSLSAAARERIRQQLL